jgi:hypothetical protein
LEDVEEEDGERPDGYDYHADFQGPSVALLGCDSQEEDGNAEFYEHHVCYVGECCKGLILCNLSMV